MAAQPPTDAPPTRRRAVAACARGAGREAMAGFEKQKTILPHFYFDASVARRRRSYSAASGAAQDAFLLKLQEAESRD
eukprot:5623927-Prymnesium_polylepis.1